MAWMKWLGLVIVSLALLAGAQSAPKGPGAGRAPPGR